MQPIPYYFDHIERSAVMVKAKQPFFDWLNAVDPVNPMFPPQDGNLYLVKSKDDNAALEKWLKTNFDKIFVNELNDWHTGEDEWPQKRNYKLFNEWFDIRFEATVLDTEETDY